MLRNFKGDLNWIHNREGHVGKAYWPGGASGVTLDPGYDLGYANQDDLRKYYGGILDAHQMAQAVSALGVRGIPAGNLIKRLDALQSLKISDVVAAGLFPVVAEPYWNRLLVKWPEIESAPGYVQTAVLSLVYNRGVDNPHLHVITIPIVRKDWNALGEKIAAMQQDHKLPGISKRRRLEGALIISNLSKEPKPNRFIAGLKKVIAAPLQMLK